MSIKVTKALLAIACGAGVALAGASAGSAQSQPETKQRSTPKNFSWDYGKNGKVVRKSRAVTGPDGTVREEVPLGGKCVRVIERTPEGSKRVDKC